MPEFDGALDYDRFERSIRHASLYVLAVEHQKFIDTVLETASTRTRTFDAGHTLWRSQLAHEPIQVPLHMGGPQVIYKPAVPERMKPLKDRAYEGRVNPKGIPCLYLNTDAETAMREVRPWIGSFVSVASFIVVRHLTFVDCATNVADVEDFDMSRIAEFKENSVWRSINRAFSQPVTPCDDVADYAPTQILAEAFKHHRYDGIIYASSLGSGENVALFDTEGAVLVGCALHQVEAIEVRFSGPHGSY